MDNHATSGDYPRPILRPSPAVTPPKVRLCSQSVSVVSSCTTGQEVVRLVAPLILQFYNQSNHSCTHDPWRLMVRQCTTSGMTIQDLSATLSRLQAASNKFWTWLKIFLRLILLMRSPSPIWFFFKDPIYFRITPLSVYIIDNVLVFDHNATDPECKKSAIYGAIFSAHSGDVFSPLHSHLHR
jgi:hypothetical protein